MLRLGLFLAFMFLVYLTLTDPSGLTVAFTLSVLLLFIVLSTIDGRLKRRIKIIDIFIDINSKEVAALGGDYSAFNAGNEFTDPSHDYTFDLDIFGEGSIFQYLNRTATIFGKLNLADYFKNAYTYGDKVNGRQQAVQELAGMVEMRQKLQLIFHSEQIAESDKEEMTMWLGSSGSVKNMNLLRALAYGLPTVTLVSILLSFAGIISFPIALIILQLMVVFLYGKQTIKIQSIITSKSKILNKYAQSLELIENAQFNSQYLNDFKMQLTGSGQRKPSQAIHQLSVILKYMDSNLNLLVAVILNGLFMFNLHLLIKVEKWKKQNQKKVPVWFDSIASFDAMCSLANFAYNNPAYIYPEVTNNGFRYDAENLGHPLIQDNQRIVNDIEIQGWNQFFIVTGANMSGKSTFLRTVGVNFILAMMGAPVCASRLIFSPIMLHSSIRTSDSLSRNESYFYAELKRLKQIIDELESGKQKFILLDEILKGTNSKDKQAGSIALIEQLLRYKSIGMFATHDLMLGELADHYPGNVNNLCFEIQISGDQMVIDYKLHKGVCKNLNATYLMKNMGILMPPIK